MPLQRVLMSTDAVGGVWHYALDLATALSQRGIRTLLAVLGPAPDADQRKAALAIAGLRLEHSDYPLEWMQHALEQQPQAGAWLQRLAADWKPDVVHLNHFGHGHLPWPAPALVVAHSCVLSWFEHVRGQPAGPAWEDYRQLVQRGLRGAARVVAPTRAMLGDVQRLYGTDAGRVIFNGRDPRAYNSAAKRPHVLAAGRLWDEGKNLAALARVAPQLAWPVHFGGDAEHPEGGRAELPGVTLLGKLTPAAMAGAMAEASVYALPARYEPFGLSVLEAALSGCALVLGDIASLRELWQDAADFVDPDDDAALARALNRLIDDPDYRRAQAQKARWRAEHFTRQRMVEAYLATYAELAAQPEAAPCTS